MTYRKLALVLGVAALAVTPGAALAGGKQHPPKCTKKNNKGCPTVRKGRMTGHGHEITSAYGRVQWEFRNSVCNADRFPDLKVEWGGNKFRLTSYSVPLRCVDLPGVGEENPVAGFDTIIGQGTGLLNGRPATAKFCFTDRGEPGRDDRATIKIIDEDGDVVLNVVDISAGAGGNHQAHRR